MTHDELLRRIKEYKDGTVALSPYQAANKRDNVYEDPSWYALRAVVELHPPQEITLPNGSWGHGCKECDSWTYPCPTIQAIEKELK